MLGLFRGSTEGQSTDFEHWSHGAIEMKGSEAQPVKPKPAPKKQWKGLWSSTESPKRQQEQRSRAEHVERPASNTVPLQGRDAGFLETTVRANSETSLTCTTSGVHESTQLPQCQVGEFHDASCSSDPTDQDYYEVRMVMRVPRSRVPGGQNADLDELRAEVEATSRQCHQALQALDTRSQECEELLAVVRELTESRSKLSTLKNVQAERIADLQQEYMRVLRVADLSRAISKENLAKTAQTMKKLNEVEEELARQKALNQQTKERLARQKVENMELREKLSLLQRLDLLAFRRESACMVEFQQLHLKETY